MKKSEYIIPQIYVVKLRQQPLMQYASPAQAPTLRTGDSNDDYSDAEWTDIETGYYNL